MSSSLLEFIQIIKILTFKRFLNLLLIVFNYFFSRVLHRVIVKSFPFSITIEPTTACNLKCVECPTGINSLTREKGEMDFNTFKLIIDKTKKYSFYLNLYFQGEPFLNKEIVQMINYAAKNKFFVCIATNGHFINVTTANEITNNNLHKLIVSLDGISEQTYLKYRQNGNFTTVTEGIKLLADTKKRKKTKLPELTIQMLINKYNENDFEKIKSFSRSIGANSIKFKSMQIYNNYDLLPLNSKYSRYKNVNNKNFTLQKKIRNKCFRVWSNAVFIFNGNLVTCCFDKNAENTIGSIHKENIKELWQGKIFNDYRNVILKDRKKNQICRNCTE